MANLIYLASVVRRLDQILTKSIARGFKSEYDFQVAIHEAFVSAHDGHFVYAGDILRPFHFENAGARDIVSVSNDGLTVPELYLRRKSLTYDK